MKLFHKLSPLSITVIEIKSSGFYGLRQASLTGLAPGGPGGGWARGRGARGGGVQAVLPRVPGPQQAVLPGRGVGPQGQVLQAVSRGATPGQGSSEILHERSQGVGRLQ